MSKIINFSSLLVLALVFSLLISISVISAQVATPKIKVTLINQDPDPVEQNDIVEVRFKVENEGTATTSDVFIQLLPEYPFSLYSGDAVQDVGKLRAGQTGADAVIVRYKLKVDKNAQKGDNEIKVQLRIGEGLWQTYEDNNFFINIKDYNVPGIKVYLKDTTIKTAGEKGTVTLEIANADKADVKFLQLTLLPSGGYQILSSSNYVYVGDVASDDTQTEDFDIYTNKSSHGEIILPVQIIYQDSNDKKYNNTFSLKLKVYSQSELNAFGLSKNNNAAYIVGALIIAAALFFYLRLKRKK